MMRLKHWIIWCLGGLSALLALAVILVLLTANTPYGRTSIERLVFIFSGGCVQLSGLSGDYLSQLSIERIVLEDAAGAWLTVDELQLDWRPGKLLSGELALDQLQARNIKLARLPVAAASADPPSKLSLPLTIDLGKLTVNRLELAPTLAGEAADFSLSGRIRISTKNRAEIELHINRLEKQGAYSLLAILTDNALNAHLSLQEDASGPLTTLLSLTNQPGLDVHASLAGPLAALHSHMELNLGELHALLDGEIDWVQSSVDLMLTARAPAMKLRPDLAWQTLALNMQLRGPLSGLNANGDLQFDKLNIGSTNISRLAINLQGTNGQLKLDGELAGLGLSVADADLLQAESLMFQATVDVDKPDYPCTLAIQHRLITANGQATIKDDRLSANLAVTLPNLQPVAALVGLQMSGSGKLTLNFAQQDTNNRLDIDGQLNLGGGDKLWAKLLGEAAKFDLNLTQQGNDISVSAFHIQGNALSLTAVGGLIAGQADFNWHGALDKLSAIIPGETGRLSAQGRLTGQMDDFKLSSELNGELGSQSYPNGTMAANLQLQHLPYRADGRLTLNGELIKAPLAMQLTVNSPDPNTIRIVIDKANWKSTQAIGYLQFGPGSPIPASKIELKIEHLADLQPLIKQTLSGSVNASMEAAMQNSRQQAKFMLTANNIGLKESVAINSTSLELSIDDLAGRPRLVGLLDLKGVRVGTLAGGAQIKLNGELDALFLRMSAALPNLSGSDAQVNFAALLNTRNNTLVCNALDANWRQQTLRLLAPAKITYSDGLSVDRLHLGLQQAELELAGRIAPDLALTAELHQTSAELLSLFAPIPAISGTLHADANLQGSLLQPTGLLHIEANRLQFKHNQGLPPAQFIASAVLHGESIDVDAALKAGSNIDLRIAGQAPMNRSGLFTMHSEAVLDLKLLDPILNASGRQIGGQLAANAQLVGNWSSPLLSGTAQITQGKWHDFSNSVVLNDISAALAIEEQTLRIVTLQSRAGPGTLSATGNIGLFAPGMPIDLTITARNAQLLADDQLSVNLDADIMMGGLTLERMTASGRIHLNRADIQIQDRLPAGIAVLKLSGDGSASTSAATTPEKSRNISLNLTIEAPREIFIRGRGVDAELGGTVLITGDLNHPHPQGDFKLRHGQYMLAGQVLVFNQGSVGFDNNSLTNPSLNFVANSTRNNITATVTVTGSPRQLKISLSSIPILPQDEVLANLLFGKGAASLSPLEMVQISTALASLTGVTSGFSDPLESTRKRLGLDRLSVGGVNPTLDVGRYIAPGVYLGAKQGITGGAPQPILQIDLTKHLKLEGGVGSGAATSSSQGSASTNSLGVIYQIEY